MSNITVTNIDPGEGSPLSSDNFIAVYGQNSLLDIFYPVGSYYETSNTSFDPNTAWGGVWVEDTSGRVTVAKDNSTFSTVNATGGEESHSLTEAELPEISAYWRIHGQENGTEFYNIYGYATGTKIQKYTNTNSQGTGAFSYQNPGFKFGQNDSHNNLQPYIVVKRWHRTA